MGVTNKIRGVTLHAGGFAGGDEPDSEQTVTNTADIAAAEILIGTPVGVSNAADIADNVTALAGKATIGQIAGVRVPTANDILVLTDAGKAVEMNNASARTITVPPNTDVAFPVGTIIRITRFGAGTTLLVEGVAVTINSPAGDLHLAAQFSSAILYQRAADDWVLAGDLSATGA
jgi:hypothetical protein